LSTAVRTLAPPPPLSLTCCGLADDAHARVADANAVSDENLAKLGKADNCEVVAASMALPDGDTTLPPP
jgi:hypothetical protein